jgi:hypothetical protein
MCGFAAHRYFLARTKVLPKPRNGTAVIPNKEMATPFLYLQQLPIKRTTRIILKALRSNAFKIICGSGLSAKRCKKPYWVWFSIHKSVVTLLRIGITGLCISCPQRQYCGGRGGRQEQIIETQRRHHVCRGFRKRRMKIHLKTSRVQL